MMRVAHKYLTQLATSSQTPWKTQVNEVLPGAAQDIQRESIKPVALFWQKTVAPKGISKALCDRAVDRALNSSKPVSFDTLTPSERTYVLAVLGEVRGWATAQVA